MMSVMMVMMKRTEYGLWYCKFCVVHRPDTPHRQLQLELTVCVREVPCIQIADWNIISVPLRWRIICKLYLFPRESLVNTKVFPVEECECEVHINSHAFRRVSPDQVHTQNFVGARESNGPFVIAARELF